MRNPRHTDDATGHMYERDDRVGGQDGEMMLQSQVRSEIYNNM